MMVKLIGLLLVLLTGGEGIELVLLRQRQKRGQKARQSLKALVMLYHPHLFLSSMGATTALLEDPSQQRKSATLEEALLGQAEMVSVEEPKCPRPSREAGSFVTRAIGKRKPNTLEEEKDLNDQPHSVIAVQT